MEAGAEGRGGNGGRLDGITVCAVPVCAVPVRVVLIGVAPIGVVLIGEVSVDSVSVGVSGLPHPVQNRHSLVFLVPHRPQYRMMFPFFPSSASMIVDWLFLQSISVRCHAVPPLVPMPFVGVDSSGRSAVGISTL
ncbi:hypothetical protein BSTEL_0714 [Bifidobacterium stellenboschense]|uniref:Uncharacterized protein n=1 Tax=Bifidobacterium stellenboschense TaxID=762211 RepID=A0A087DQV3_9BIFI|nr:hypothetical protein BSTEL_0714 [Bifidobacterium stellenboschense]